MFLGPLQDSKPWSETGIEGSNRFLNRVWRMLVTEDGKLSEEVQDMPMNAEQEFILHSTIKKIGEDIEGMRFNTAIAQMMIFVNEFYKYKQKPREAMEKFVLCLTPFAPHISEELWHLLGHNESVTLQSYPIFDEKKAVKNQIEMVVQVNSKIRGKFPCDLDLTQEEVEARAKEDEKVQSYLEGKQIRKVIFVQNKIINFIVS
jgi:leucyl-tRNA synthetase